MYWELKFDPKNIFQAFFSKEKNKKKVCGYPHKMLVIHLSLLLYVIPVQYRSFLFFSNIFTFTYREYYSCFDDYYAANHINDRLVQLIKKYEIEKLKNRINLLNGL